MNPFQFFGQFFVYKSPPPMKGDRLYRFQLYGMSNKELRKLGGVQPPREFVFMDRVAVGIGSVFMHLKAEINWYKLFHEIIENFSAKDVNTRQEKALKKVNLSL